MEPPERVELFRSRLQDSVRRSGLSRSEFAAAAGIDRSTLSQLLSPRTTRLPRLDTVLALAEVQGESIDWLAGLTELGPVQAEILSHTSFEEPGPTPSDEVLMSWLAEAAGYRIRYVPSTLPDLLKSDAIIRYERQSPEGPTAAQTIETTSARLAWARNPDTEMECYSSWQSVATFARGEGIYQRVRTPARRDQMDRMIELTRELYPRFRWFMFDGMKLYASPVTLFGMQRAAFYLGQLYLVLTSAEHVRTMHRHLDSLVRESTVQAHSVPQYLMKLRRELD